jgi:hypothetical protein
MDREGLAFLLFHIRYIQGQEFGTQFKYLPHKITRVFLAAIKGGGFLGVE